MLAEQKIENTGVGEDKSTRGLTPFERITFQGKMEQERAHQKALGVQPTKRVRQPASTAPQPIKM